MPSIVVRRGPGEAIGTGRAVMYVCLFACAVYLLHLATAVYVERALWLDGGQFFVDMLSKEYSWPASNDTKHNRLFANYVNQFPAAAAVRVGIDNMRALRLLYGVGLFFAPVIVYSWCFLLSRRANDYRVFSLAMVGLITCVLPSEIFILNQGNIAVALCWLLLHYALLKVDVCKYDLLVIVSALAISFSSHEGMLIWGPTVALASAIRIVRYERGSISNANVHVYTIGLFGLLHALFVKFWFAIHPVERETSAFLQLLTLASPSAMWSGYTRISLMVAGVAALVSLFMVCRRDTEGEYPSENYLALGVIAAIAMVLSLAKGVSAIIDPTAVKPYDEYHYRFLIPFGSVLWMLVAVTYTLRGAKYAAYERRLIAVVLSAGLIASSIWQFSHDVQWYRYRKEVARVLQDDGAPIVSPEVIEARFHEIGRADLFKYAGNWVWPTFGLSLQDQRSVKRLVRPTRFEEYFVIPTQPGAYPTVPFVWFTEGGYFRFDELVSAYAGLNGERDR